MWMQWWTRLQATYLQCYYQRSVNDFISCRKKMYMYASCYRVYSPTPYSGNELEPRENKVCVHTDTRSRCVCVCVNGMHKSGTKQAATWHTDLLLGTFTARTDVTDWTVCRLFSLSLVSPLFFLLFFKKKTQNDEENNTKRIIIIRRRTRNILNFSSFLFHLLII